MLIKRLTGADLEADKAMIKRLIVVDQVAVRHRSHGLVGADHADDRG